jgi:hypothetical protein
MGDVIINQGKTNTLVITLPAKGDVDWASKVRQAFQDICDHDHTGGIKGKKITGDALAENTITINNIDLSSVNLNTFLDIQDGTTIPSGSVLLWSEENQEWYPSTIQNVNSSSNVYVISNDTDLNGYDPTPGDILYIDVQGQSVNTAFSNGVAGAADFSHYNKNLRGVKIISNNIPLIMAELDECAIMSWNSIILADSVTNCAIRSSRHDITIQSHFNNSQANSGTGDIILDNGAVQYSSLHGIQLRDTSASGSFINYSQGFFYQLNITTPSTTIASTSKIEATEGIVSLAGLPSASAYTGFVTIERQEVRIQKLPETATNNDILAWNGTEWSSESYHTQGAIAKVNFCTQAISFTPTSPTNYTEFSNYAATFTGAQTYFNYNINVMVSSFSFGFYLSTGVFEIDVNLGDSYMSTSSGTGGGFFALLTPNGRWYDYHTGAERTGSPINSDVAYVFGTGTGVKPIEDEQGQNFSQIIRVETSDLIFPAFKPSLVNGQINFHNVQLTVKKISDI